MDPEAVAESDSQIEYAKEWIVETTAETDQSPARSARVFRNVNASEHGLRMLAASSTMSTDKITSACAGILLSGSGVRAGFPDGSCRANPEYELA